MKMKRKTKHENKRAENIHHGFGKRILHEF